jgi:OFA family oxalate/formate antiporter-like MFS transporter
MSQRRWVQVALITVAIVAAANLQYCWTLFAKPLADGYGVSLGTVQIAFSLFIIAQTWLLPVEGWMVDRIGPRPTFFLAGILIGLGWIGTAQLSPSIQFVWIWYLLGGIGVGIVYGGGLGLVVRWFPERRGLVAGIAAAGYGSGTLLTIGLIGSMLNTAGYQSTMTTWGVGLAIACCVCSIFLRVPPAAAAVKTKANAAVPQSLRDYKPMEMLRLPTFWALYASTTLMAFTGLVITAQLGPIASDFGADQTVVAFGATALTIAIQVDRVLNGISRPIWGWISDRLGRYLTMTLAFIFQAAGILIWMAFLDSPILFILCSGFVFIGWSEIYSMGAAITADLFGERYAATNYGVLFTGKGFSAIVAGPVTAWLVEGSNGNWLPVFAAMAACAALAAIIVFFWLRPAAARQLEPDHVAA